MPAVCLWVGAVAHVDSGVRRAQGVGKITVVGAAGGIGQPLSMLLKLNVPSDVLALYDVSPASPGVAADVGHVSTKGKVRPQYPTTLTPY